MKYMIERFCELFKNDDSFAIVIFIMLFIFGGVFTLLILSNILGII